MTGAARCVLGLFLVADKHVKTEGLHFWISGRQRIRLTHPNGPGWAKGPIGAATVRERLPLSTAMVRCPGESLTTFMSHSQPGAGVRLQWNVHENTNCQYWEHLL